MKVLGISYNLSQNYFQSKILDSERIVFEARYIFSKFMPNFCQLTNNYRRFLDYENLPQKSFILNATTVNGQNFELGKILILTYIESVIYL